MGRVPQVVRLLQFSYLARGDWRYATTALEWCLDEDRSRCHGARRIRQVLRHSQISPLVLAGERYYFDDPVLRPSNLLQGGGTLSATVVPQRNAALTLTGTGALAGAGFSSYARTSALSGAGALTSGAYIYSFAVSAALGAVGALTATRTSQYYELRPQPCLAVGRHRPRLSRGSSRITPNWPTAVGITRIQPSLSATGVPVGTPPSRRTPAPGSCQWDGGRQLVRPFLRQAATSPMWPGCRN